jgi:hypothetical protein
MGLATAAIIGGVVAGGTAIANSSAASANRRAAAAAAGDKNAMIAELRDMMPDVSDLELELMLPQLVGEFEPEVMKALDLGPSAMEDVAADEQLKLEQLEALTGIGEVAEGGFTEADKAGMREFDRGNQQNLQANIETILQGQAARGTEDSGASLAAQLAAAQKSTDMRASASDRMIQDAQNRSLQALMQQGSLAGNMRSQDFGEQSQVARARDAINQFNVQNSQNIGNQNVANRNEAQRMNLANKQAISNAQVGMQNQQQMHNKNLLVDNYNRNKNLTGMSMGVRQQLADQEQQANTRQAEAIGQAGQGLVSMFGGKS